MEDCESVEGDSGGEGVSGGESRGLPSSDGRASRGSILAATDGQLQVPAGGEKRGLGGGCNATETTATSRKVGVGGGESDATVRQ